MAAAQNASPDEPEIIEVETRTVACDGNGGALGHPRVWINLGANGRGECGYCDRVFVLRVGVKLADGH